MNVTVRRFCVISLVTLLPLLLVVALMAFPAAAAPAVDAICVDFEGLTAGTTYPVGQQFVDSGAVVTVHPFAWSDGTIYNGGHALVDDNIFAGGSGLDVNTNNANLEFDFGRRLYGLAIQAGEYGGNLNIEINGDFHNFEDFADIDGMTIGGVTASFVATPIMGGYQGRLLLDGPIDAFSVGGQELWVDDFCPASACIEYESLPGAAVYTVSDSFVDAGIPMEVTPFTWSNSTVYTGGHAMVSYSQLAGGTGQDLNLNNVNLAFAFARKLDALSLYFGEYGGNVNLQVNGVFTNVANLAALNGANFAGAQLTVVNGFGNDKGRLILQGPVADFAIGGQELWIDHVCFVERFELYLPFVVR